MNRRKLMRVGVGLPVSLGVITAVAACSRDPVRSCEEAGELSAAEASLRKSMNYQEQSPAAGKTCSGCAFFSADTSSGCGSCQLFDGGPVNPGGHCDSWSAA